MCGGASGVFSGSGSYCFLCVVGLVEVSVVVVGFVFSVALQVFIVLFVALIMVIVCLEVLIIFVFLARAVALVSYGHWHVVEEVLPLRNFMSNPLYSLFFCYPLGTVALT